MRPIGTRHCSARLLQYATTTLRVHQNLPSFNKSSHIWLESATSRQTRTPPSSSQPQPRYTMSSKNHLLELLSPLLHSVSDLNLRDPVGAREEITRQWPLTALHEIRHVLAKAQEDGWLTPRQAAPGVCFGRVVAPTEQTHMLSVDAVDMSTAGAEHSHPEGEVSLCFATQGSPTFDGHAEGWVIMPPGSHHTPTVRDGRMTIVYFLPNGAVRWGPLDDAPSNS